LIPFSFIFGIMLAEFSAEEKLFNYLIGMGSDFSKKK
jgi:hypothetical protein